MDVSVAEAAERLPELIRAVEGGDQVILTQDGKPVAQITQAPEAPPRRKPRLGSMKDRTELLPGWDDPIDWEPFLDKDL